MIVELVGFVLTVIGLPVSIGIAVWQQRKAEAADRARQAVLDSMPGKVAEQVRLILASSVPQPPSELPMGEFDGRVRRISTHDVDGDGQSELLVEYQVGIHGSGLKLFTWMGYEFREVAELWSDCETAYEVGDFDGDGATEIRAWISDPRAGDLAYAARPWVRVTYRWQGGHLEAVDWQPEASDVEIDQLYAEHGRLSATAVDYEGEGAGFGF